MSKALQNKNFLNDPGVDATNIDYNPLGTGAVPISIQNKLEQVINVLDFGADPSGVLDSSIAITNAVLYAAQNNLTLRIPAGDYAVHSTITITGYNNWSIIGDGMYASKLIRKNLVCATVLNIVSCNNVVVKDLGFDGGYDTYVGSANHAFVFNDCANARGENLYATNFKNGGLNGFVTNGTQKSNIQFIGCEVDGLSVANNGINIGNAIDSGIENCHVKNCPGAPGYGLQLKNVSERSYIRSSTVEGCTAGIAFGNDISAAGVRNCSVSDVIVYNCETGIITGYASNNVFDNISINMNNIVGYGIDLQNGSNNNAFRNIVARNINTTRTLFYVRAGNYNTVEISLLENPTVISSTVGILSSGVTNTRINLGQIITASYQPYTRLVEDNSGNNTNIFLINNERRVELRTLATNAISFTTGGVSTVRLDTEGLIALDELDTINGPFADNQVINVQISNNARTVLVRDASVSGGNILLTNASPCTLNAISDSLELMYKDNISGGGKWVEVSRSTMPFVYEYPGYKGPAILGNVYYDGSVFKYAETVGAGAYYRCSGQLGFHSFFASSTGAVKGATASLQQVMDIIGGTSSATNLVSINANINAAPVYSRTVGATNRAMYIDNAGAMGYLSSVGNSKMNVNNITDVSWLLNLNPVSYKYKKKDEDGNYLDEADGTTQYGLIAEEVASVNPLICFYDEVEGVQELKGVGYTSLISPMLKLLQQQQQKIAELETRLAVLESV